MKKEFILILVLVIITVAFIFNPKNTEENIWNNRIDAALEPVDCPPVEEIEYPDSYYKGPLIDTHYHLPNIRESIMDGGPEPILGEDIYQFVFWKFFKIEALHPKYHIFRYADVAPVKVEDS